MPRHVCDHPKSPPTCPTAYRQQSPPALPAPLASKRPLLSPEPRKPFAANAGFLWPAAELLAAAALAGATPAGRAIHARAGPRQRPKPPHGWPQEPVPPTKDKWGCRGSSGAREARRGGVGWGAGGHAVCDWGICLRFDHASRAGRPAAAVPKQHLQLLLAVSRFEPDGPDDESPHHEHHHRHHWWRGALGCATASQ